MRSMLGIIVVSSLVLAGCGPQGGKPESAADQTKRMQDEAAAARSAIDGVNAQYIAHLNALHGDSLAALFVEDGRMMPPNGPTAVGRQAIAAAMNSMAGSKPTLALTTQSLEANGPMAVEVGTYKFSLQPPGQTPPINDSGKYMVHWRKLGDRWMLVDDIWNSDLAAMPMPMPTPKKP